MEGIHTALTTPMHNGTVDEDGLRRHVIRQLEAGVDGIVVCATTGEGSALSAPERELVIRTAAELVGGRARLTVGTGRISTIDTIAECVVAAELGADAALVVTPPYVRPSQAGLEAHFEAVADDGGLPVVLYNVPSRTGCDLLPAAVERLAAHPNIVGIKEATGSVLRAQQVIAAAGGRMSVLSGDDPLTLSLLVAGGQGVICTASNAVPERWVELWKQWRAVDVVRAAEIQARLRPLHEALFCEANPGPVKGALWLLGVIEPEIRAPLTWPTGETLEKLRRELGELGYEVRR